MVEFDENGRIKRFTFLKEVYLSLVIILVATLSFGVGRLTGEGDRGPIKIEYDQSLVSNPSQGANSQTASVLNSVTTQAQEGQVVGSSKSDKYHYPHCPGAKQISEANKITFDSPATAEASGYTLAGNCKPR